MPNALTRISHQLSVLSGPFARLLRCETLSVLDIYTYMAAEDNVPRLAGEQNSAPKNALSIREACLGIVTYCFFERSYHIAKNW